MAKLDLSKLPQVKRRLIYKIVEFHRDSGKLETWKKSGGPARLLNLSDHDLKVHLDRLRSGESGTASKKPPSFGGNFPAKDSDDFFLFKDGKPICGWCSTHPKLPAVAVVGPLFDEKTMKWEKYIQHKERPREWTRFCKECWENHKYKVMGLKPAPVFRASLFLPHKSTSEVKAPPKRVRQLTFEEVVL